MPDELSGSLYLPNGSLIRSWVRTGQIGNVMNAVTHYSRWGLKEESVVLKPEEWEHINRIINDPPSSLTMYGHLLELTCSCSDDAITVNLCVPNTGHAIGVNSLNILQEALAHGASFGYFCSIKELLHRNEYRAMIGPGSNEASALVGLDVSRYVPGLYWRTALSVEMYSSVQSDCEVLLKCLANTQMTRTDRGVSWSLFERAEDWTGAAETIENVLAGNEKWFSKRRMPSVLGRSTAERTQSFLDIVSAWK